MSQCLSRYSFVSPLAIGSATASGTTTPAEAPSRISTCAAAHAAADVWSAWPLGNAGSVGECLPGGGVRAGITRSSSQAREAAAADAPATGIAARGPRARHSAVAATAAIGICPYHLPSGSIHSATARVGRRRRFGNRLRAAPSGRRVSCRSTRRASTRKPAAVITPAPRSATGRSARESLMPRRDAISVPGAASLAATASVRHNSPATTGRHDDCTARPSPRRLSSVCQVDAPQRTANTDFADFSDLHRRNTRLSFLKSVKSVKSVFAVLIPRGAGQVSCPRLCVGARARRPRPSALGLLASRPLRETRPATHLDLTLSVAKSSSDAVWPLESETSDSRRCTFGGSREPGRAEWPPRSGRAPSPSWP